MERRKKGGTKINFAVYFWKMENVLSENSDIAKSFISIIY